MYYVEVVVASAAYRSDEPLTYSTKIAASVGSIVEVPLRNTRVLGIIVALVDKPSFPVKPLLDIPTLPLMPSPALELMDWLKVYYPAPFGIIVQQFLPKQLPKKIVTPLALESPPTTPPSLPPLTADQKQALAEIESQGVHLLHGETGTGKTRVYIELAQRSLASGRSAIILTPEIGLTSQLANDFRTIFGERVIVIHSQLTDVTRQRLWASLLLQKEEPVVVIGPRSALFAPLRKLGLIVVDESHETAYKQDQAPHYQTSIVAAKLAALHGCPAILGSATPLVTDYYLAKAKHRPIIRMTQTAREQGAEKAKVIVVDLRDRSSFTRTPYLSNELITSISTTIGRNEQVLLFLNRRGTARVVFCEDCGWQALCPHCDVTMVYHGDLHHMRCHSCTYQASVPHTCPECHNPSIVFKSIGTKAVVDGVRKLFPEAKVQRFDTDNKKSERIEAHYEAIKNGEVDIIVGTQTLAKGLDLPRLGLVGVIVADTSLYLPDYSAQERTYQLIGQVMGRVGRGHRSGSMILQTYSPDSPLLASILAKDWRAFYESELRERKTFLFPPFCYLLKVSCRRATQASAQKTASILAQTLRSTDLRIIVEGPAPAFREKVQNKYQWQLVIKAKERRELLRTITYLPAGWSYDIDPVNLL